MAGLTSIRTWAVRLRQVRIPLAPWVFFFNGASKKPAEHAALGFVLKNSNEQVVQMRRYLGGGISFELAKYKALIDGLKKAKSLQVKHLLVKGNSQLLVNQVVEWWAVKDARLRDHLKKVWVISKDFDSLFMEFIPKDQNVHADRIANAALNKELQIQEVVNKYFDQSGAWPAIPYKSTKFLQYSFEYRHHSQTGSSDLSLLNNTKTKTSISTKSPLVLLD